MALFKDQKPKSFKEKVKDLFQPQVFSPVPDGPVDSRSFVDRFKDFFLTPTTPQRAGAEEVSAPTPSPIPLVLPQVEEYLSSKMPRSQAVPLGQYSPAYQKVSDLATEAEKKYQRPGFKNLALLTAFNESTLGRSENIAPNNLFGFKPQGGSKGYGSVEEAFQSYVDHLEGLKGGLYPILKEKGQLKKKDIKRLYQNYNPEGAYLDDLLTFFPE